MLPLARAPGLRARAPEIGLLREPRAGGRRPGARRHRADARPRAGAGRRSHRAIGVAVTPRPARPGPGRRQSGASADAPAEPIPSPGAVGVPRPRGALRGSERQPPAAAPDREAGVPPGRHLFVRRRGGHLGFDRSAEPDDPRRHEPRQRRRCREPELLRDPAGARVPSPARGGSPPCATARHRSVAARGGGHAPSRGRDHHHRDLPQSDGRLRHRRLQGAHRRVCGAPRAPDHRKRHVWRSGVRRPASACVEGV